MQSPLLTKKQPKRKQIMDTLEAISYLKKHFKKLGYSSRKTFCEANNLSYSTLNAILNYKPASKTKKPLPIRKIPVIFKALGFKCEIVRTVEFHVSQE